MIGIIKNYNYIVLSCDDGKYKKTYFWKLTCKNRVVNVSFKTNWKKPNSLKHIWRDSSSSIWKKIEWVTLHHINVHINASFFLWEGGM